MNIKDAIRKGIARNIVVYDEAEENDKVTLHLELLMSFFALNLFNEKIKFFVYDSYYATKKEITEAYLEDGGLLPLTKSQIIIGVTDKDNAILGAY